MKSKRKAPIKFHSGQEVQVRAAEFSLLTYPITGKIDYYLPKEKGYGVTIPRSENCEEVTIFVNEKDLKKI